MKRRGLKYFLFIIGIFVNSMAVAQDTLRVITNDLENPADTSWWINAGPVQSGDAFSGENYSTIDSSKQFGLGYKGPFPSQCLNKNLHIRLNEQIRVRQTSGGIFMVISVMQGDSMIYWESRNIFPRIAATNRWEGFEDAFDLPKNVTGGDHTLAIYVWNKDGKSVADIDDFTIAFTEKKLPSFLPVGFEIKDLNTGWTRINRSNEFVVYYNKESGAIKILHQGGDTIVSTVGLITEWREEKAGETSQRWNYHFYFKKDSISEDGTFIRFSARDEISESDLLILAGSRGNLEFDLSTIFKKELLLYRHSVGTSLPMTLKEIVSKSTLSETADFNKEYWLDKEGFIVSGKRKSILVYHPSNVSSMQLDVQKKVCYFNADYCADHPLLHFPMLKTSNNIYEDHSPSILNKGDTIRASFTFYSVDENFKVAKLLKQPFGYLSSFTWTEHADYTNLRTQRAVYFGAENISTLEQATGGFLKYSMPVTKSIFYSNPDKVDNSDKAGFMPGPVATLKETEGFRIFLKQLDEYGVEVCLHTPDHFTSDRKLLSEALEATKREYAPVTWIDHGYDNSPKSNREDLNCDGLDSKSKWYAADLWKTYNIRYFWNSYFEDSGIFNGYSFNSFFQVPYGGWGEGFPSPVYWRNKTRSQDIIHWGTTSTLDPPDGSLWSYYFSDMRLTDLVNNRSCVITHCYPARVDSSTGFYQVIDGIVTANPEFNKALERLLSYRLQQKIWLTTVRDLLNYRTSLERISYEVTPEGEIVVYNNSRDEIRGVTFSARAVDVSCPKKQIDMKKDRDELVFWFDMEPQEKVTIQLK